MKFPLLISLTLVLTLLAGCQEPAQQDAPLPAMPADSQPTQAAVSRQQAIEIALSHAGLTSDRVAGLYAEWDYDRGDFHYDVEFHSGGYEYDYEISADGTVLHWEKEYD